VNPHGPGRQTNSHGIFGDAGARRNECPYRVFSIYAERRGRDKLGEVHILQLPLEDDEGIYFTLRQWDLERFGARNGAVDWKEGREPHLRRRRRGWGAPPASYLSVVGVWRRLHTFGSLGWNFRKEHRKLCG
jgi:hypothetical protein